MSKIRETITALTAGEQPGAVHVNRKEREPMSDQRFELVLKCVTQVALIAAGTILILNADIAKLVALLGFGIFFSLIYFGFQD